MLYVIGSVSQEEDIKKVAAYFFTQEGFLVEHVKKEPDKSLLTLILECFHKIAECDGVIAVKKSDGTYGTGVSYEIAFTKFIGKDLLEVSVDDIEDPKWLENRRKFYK